MDVEMLDAMCERLKLVLYTSECYIYREGDPLDHMLFVMQGKLLSSTTDGGRSGFFNSVSLGAGDFCGEELLTWSLDPHSSGNVPCSDRTADDLKVILSQLRGHQKKRLLRSLRFYSQQWRRWAVHFIQAAWRRYKRRKLEESLKLQEAASSPSLGATIYASRFAANALRGLRSNGVGKVRLPFALLQKPLEPDFTDE